MPARDTTEGIMTHTQRQAEAQRLMAALGPERVVSQILLRRC
jgi:hypothetical protein